MAYRTIITTVTPSTVTARYADSDAGSTNPMVRRQRGDRSHDAEHALAAEEFCRKVGVTGSWVCGYLPSSRRAWVCIGENPAALQFVTAENFHIFGGANPRKPAST